jgi:hypothetical protein
MPKGPSRSQKATNIVPAEQLAWYEQLVATIPGLERKGATVPYTSWNGHMFSYLTPDGTLALRLPDQARVEFLGRYHTRLVENYGIVQKEYVVVPEALLHQTQELQAYFQSSFEYVNSLRPKPHKQSQPKSGRGNA